MQTNLSSNKQIDTNDPYVLIEAVNPENFTENFFLSQLEIIELLVDSGFNLNHNTYISEVTPLELVIEHGGNLKLIECLLNLGADPNFASIGRGALHIACARGNIKIVKTLLRAGSCLEQNPSGETPLFTAACNGHIKLVRFLVKIGANVNYLSYRETTALFRAAQAGQEEVFNYLLPLTTCRVQRMLARLELPDGIRRHNEWVQNSEIRQQQLTEIQRWFSEQNSED